MSTASSRAKRHAILPAFSLLLLAGAARAQQGFALDRYEPAERGSDWFIQESLDLRGHGRFAAGFTLDWAHKPLVAYDADGNELADVVGDQLFGHVGGAVVLWDRVRFGLNLPVALVQGGETVSGGGATLRSDGATTIGDVRLAGDVRLLGEYRGPITVGAGVRVHAPTGSQDSFTSDGTLRASLRAMAAGQVGWFVYGGNLAFDLRPADDGLAGGPGSQVGLGAAAGASLLDDKLVVGPELSTSTVVSDGDKVFGRTSTPLEVIVGGNYRFHPAMTVGAGVGPGLTRAFGTPQLRGLLSFTWFEAVAEAPPPPPPDRDSDGILDADDACPDEAGVKTDDPKTNGCPPPPPDRDGDGILDADDACPDEAGVKTDDPRTNGCPPPKDGDGDGIVDPEDACPNEPGLKTDDPKTSGCPDPDRDKDGITNAEDACPDAAGPANDDKKKHGCPVARMESGRIFIREQVQFATSSDRILRASDSILEAVKTILVEHPEITRLSIQGYTDDKGSDVYNKKLSERRAASVVKWLTKNGIDKSRLESAGFGEEKPIADNTTEEGRAENRRVEFHLVDQPAPAAESKK